MLGHNGKLLIPLVAVFGLPLPLLSLVSGLNASVAVLLFLAVFFVIAYLLKKEYWKDVH